MKVKLRLTFRHTFLATVEGQASVVKGDSLLLLDDANSYWWLVRVLKTEDVGYIPAENVETPFERLARLNKHRNVDLAAATQLEKEVGEVGDKGKSKTSGMRTKSRQEKGDAPRKVIFAPPTYVEHPGVTWSSDEEESGDEEGMEGDMEENEQAGEEYDSQHTDGGISRVNGDRTDMEPDDGIEWAENAGLEQQKRILQNRQQPRDANGAPVAQSNNPFARQNGQPPASTSNNSVMSNGPSTVIDPAEASNETRRITATPAVAQGQSIGVLLPSAAVQQYAQTGARNVSGQSIGSVTSLTSQASSQRSATPTSPTDEAKKGGKKSKVEEGGKKRKGVLSGLFSRKKDKDKKGSANDPRSSEESTISGVNTSPASQIRYSQESASPHRRAPTPGERHTSPQGPVVSQHGLRLQQQDQALQQSYSNKYLKTSPLSAQSSPNDAAHVVAQSAAAMRFANISGQSTRPASIILSPNPSGPPLLNVLRVFAGEHIKSDATFKTVLLNETTSSSDLIRQAMQRFHLSGASNPTADQHYYLTVKDLGGEEMELNPGEKPLAAFNEVVARWAEDETQGLTATVKRSSISSISSIASLSSHPAIAKLGMNDYSDDSAVKIYLNRRRPGSLQASRSQSNGMPEPNNEFSSYSTQLSTVQESSPGHEDSEAASSPGSPDRSAMSENGTASPPTPRRNPGLTIVTTGGPASPERFSSPSAKFTIQLIIHPSDLPEGSAFDPATDAILSKTVLRDRQAAGQNIETNATDPKKRLLVLPRNATVVEAIEQGLERFGIQEGVVDGGDDVEGRRVGQKVRYSLTAVQSGQGESFSPSSRGGVINLTAERHLFPSSKVLDAYTVSPTLRPIERTTVAERRRSRDITQTLALPSDIKPTDPTFVLRRVAPKSPVARMGGQANTFQRLTQPEVPANQSTLSAQEIIAAQRAASRATQKALISAQANQSQGVDVVVRDKGTLRSSRLLEPSGNDVVRYSFIDDDGETYDISELLEEEWGAEGEAASPNLAVPPPLLRQGTDASAYVTAPSTPLSMSEQPILGVENIPPRPDSAGSSHDILHTVLQRAAGQPERKLEEKLQRVIEKVKHVKATRSIDDVNGRTTPQGRVQTHNEEQDQLNGSSTPQRPAAAISSTSLTSGRTTPQSRRDLSPLPEGRMADLTPRSSDRPAPAPANPFQWQQQQSQPAPSQPYHQTAASVNRIISRHRQQPSIASIMSDLSAPTVHDTSRELEEDEGSSTPLTATSSTHPTPPPHYAAMSLSTTSASSAIFNRSVNSVSPSPTPRTPVSYTDDFGIKALMAIVQARSKEYGPPRKVKLVKEVDAVEKMYYGTRVEMDSVPQEIRACFGGLQTRLDAMDREIDGLLAEVAGTGRGGQGKGGDRDRERRASRASKASEVESLKEE